MTIIVTSFTRLLKAVADGTIEEGDLDDAIFCFGCFVSHAKLPWRDEVLDFDKMAKPWLRYGTHEAVVPVPGNELTNLTNKEGNACSWNEAMKAHAVVLDAMYWAERAYRLLDSEESLRVVDAEFAASDRIPYPVEVNLEIQKVRWARLRQFLLQQDQPLELPDPLINPLNPNVGENVLAAVTGAGLGEFYTVI